MLKPDRNIRNEQVIRINCFREIIAIACLFRVQLLLNNNFMLKTKRSRCFIKMNPVTKHNQFSHVRIIVLIQSEM